AAGTALDQPEIDTFQQQLARAVLDDLHEPLPPPEPLSIHLVTATEEAFSGLRADPAFARLIDADTIILNNAPARGPRAALRHITDRANAPASIDSAEQVRLHGDFFLENILWRPAAVGPGPAAPFAPQLILVDPVSVAGVIVGPPVFDLVKYESYARGEL